MITRATELTRLGDVLTLKRGYDLAERERRAGPIPIVSSSGITGYHDIPKVRGPGVVTGRYGTLGEVFYIRGDFWPLNTSLYVQDFKGNNPRFCSYLLKSMQLGTGNVAAAVPGVNRNHLHELLVHCPSLPVQKRIAELLGSYDDLIENNTRRIAILEEMARRIFDEWFVRFRAPGCEGGRKIDSPLGPIPRGWRVVRLDEVIEFDPKTACLNKGLKPFVPMEALQTNSMFVVGVTERDQKSGAKFKNGDTLLARITPCLENGKTGFVDFLDGPDEVGVGSTEYIVMRGNAVTPEFVQILARSEIFRSHAIKSMGGADGRQRVRRDSLEQFQIALPPADTLQQYSRMVEPMFKLGRSLVDANANLRDQRDLLLPRLISGEIDVSESVNAKEAAE